MPDDGPPVIGTEVVSGSDDPTVNPLEICVVADASTVPVPEDVASDGSTEGPLVRVGPIAEEIVTTPRTLAFAFELMCIFVAGKQRKEARMF